MNHFAIAATTQTRNGQHEGQAARSSQNFKGKFSMALPKAHVLQQHSQIWELASLFQSLSSSFPTVDFSYKRALARSLFSLQYKSKDLYVAKK